MDLTYDNLKLLSDIKSTTSENVPSISDIEQDINMTKMEKAIYYIDRAAQYINCMNHDDKQQLLLLFDRKVGRNVRVGRMFVRAMYGRFDNNKSKCL
jgi:UDP-N-acetylglucosamine enolpyruvyl transferase